MEDVEAEPPPSLVRALRAFAALVALALVGAQLTSIGHHVLVAHYLCATHGTLHHGTAPEALESERDHRPLAVPSDKGDHGAHDECSFPAKTPPEMDVAPTTRVVTDGAAATAADTNAGACGGHFAIALLALAPKLSPPAV